MSLNFGVVQPGRLLVDQAFSRQGFSSPTLVDSQSQFLSFSDLVYAQEKAISFPTSR
jgi:hypothetical protein